MDIIPHDTPQKQCKDCGTSIPASSKRPHCEPCEEKNKQRRKERINERRKQHLGEPKTCKACEQTFPATSAYFHKAALSKDGWDSRCKKCKGDGCTFGLELPECEEGEKCCVGCLNVFPATTAYFHKAKGVLHPRCKRCRGNSTYFGKERVKCNDDEKWCPSCERVLPKTREYFSLHNRKSFQGWCKECRNKTYGQNKDAISKQRRAERKANPEKFREYDRLRYARNPQAVKDRNKRSYMRNWHKSRHSRNLYRLAHLEEHNTYMRNRNMLKKSIPGTHTAQDIQDQYRRQKGRCYYCKVKLGKGKNAYQVDHTFPVKRMIGTGIPANDKSYLVVTCKPCNASKQDRFPWEWPQGGRLL